MNYRDKQFELFENMPVWYDEIMSNYEAAFWIHHRILNKEIEVWIQETGNEDEDTRVIYFIHTTYLNMVYTEMLITVELLFKAELDRAGVKSIRHSHKLIGFMDEMMATKDKRCMDISKRFDECRSIFTISDHNDAFINSRYIDYKKWAPDTDGVDQIKKVVCVLDEVYNEFYADFDIESLLYLGMINSMDDTDLTDDEERRLKRIGLA